MTNTFETNEGKKESQQRNRRYKEEPNGNFRTGKKRKKKSSVVGLKGRMERKEERK